MSGALRPGVRAAVLCGWRVLTVPRGRRGRSGRRRGSRTGVALVVVLAAIMIMTVVVTEMNFGARMRLILAANQRDEAQAYWLARSGVNIYRLVLTANYQLKNMSYLQDISSSMGINIGDALWQAVPYLSTGLMRMLFVSGGSVDDMQEEDIRDVMTSGTVSSEMHDESLAVGRFDDDYFLDFDGDFVAEIIDEDSRINVNNFKDRQSTSNLLEDTTALMLYGIMSGQENDEWFYERGLDRWELIGNLADWVDTDSTRSGNYSGYEDDLYNRLESPYLTKNAPFDSKEEIRLVEGWQDEVFEKFEDQITVWGSGKVNVNTADRDVLFGLLKKFGVSTPSDDFAYQLVDLIDTYKTVTSFQKPDDFINYLKNDLGFEVSSELKDVIATSSSVFRVTSSGVVDDTSVTITAVLDYTTSTGSVRYWRVE